MSNSLNVDPKKTYIGPVVDNNDPKKSGRVKIRVMDIFDGMKDEDLPWASPWKDLNGNQFNIPDTGKVVTVVFENGNKNNPEYISSDHYNINLEKKLASLNDADYLSMKSLFFDHKTQMYVNDGEGLKIDHKFNNINIKEQSIDINLKDNLGKINIGSQNSTQRAILGDNFTNWFDEFLNILLGGSGGGFLGNLGVPTQATPALISHIQKYFSTKTSKLLSKNVYIVDNEYVKILTKKDDTSYIGSPTRFYDPTIGDGWESTVEKNNITKKEEAKFEPVDGPSNKTFDKPKEDAAKPVAPVDLIPKAVEEINPDVDVLKQLLKNKNYKLYEKPYEMNIVAIRNQCLSKGKEYTNDFSDNIYIFYKDDYLKWHIKKYKYSTMPGTEFTLTENWLNEQNLPKEENEYWKTKLNTKITLKDFYKGIPKIKIDPPPSNESLLTKKDDLKEVKGLSANNSSLNSFGSLSSNNSLALNQPILSPIEIAEINKSKSNDKSDINVLNTDISKIPDLKDLSDLNNQIPTVTKVGNTYITFGRSSKEKDPNNDTIDSTTLNMFEDLKKASIKDAAKNLSKSIGKQIELLYSNTDLEDKVYLSADKKNYISVVKIKWKDTSTSDVKNESLIKIMDKGEVIKFLRKNDYEKEIANKDIKSFTQEKFVVSNSISKTKSVANIAASNINEFVVNNNIKTSTEYTTYLKENNGNIDLLHIKAIEK